MMHPSPFSHQPDPELGNLLRAALSPQDNEAFTDRVLAGFDEAQRRGLPFVDVLAGWSRAGMVAAITAAIIGMYLLRPGSPILETATSIDDILAEEPVPAALVAAPAPDPNAILAIAIDR